MQFEDLGRLRAHIGEQLELWLLSGTNAWLAQAVRKATVTRAAQAGLQLD